ncbi:MAG: NAD(P)-dependent oxidoreductase, partial [Thermodesulfobacteriota bacterium]
AGARRAASPREAAAGAEVIVICVSDTPDVEEVVLGAGGLINGAGPGSVVVDCSTICPRRTRAIGEALAAQGVGMLDAPVSGGSEGARLGTLSIMVGGRSEDLEKAGPILSAMGKTITHVGPLGSGQFTKAINQIICAGNYLAVAEGLVLGIKAGLDMDKVVEAVRGGAAASWVLQNRSGNVLKNEYPLGFRVSLHRKDLGYALEAAKDLEVGLPLTALVAQMFNSLMALGRGDEDVSSLARVIREQAGLK